MPDDWSVEGLFRKGENWRVFCHEDTFRQWYIHSYLACALSTGGRWLNQFQCHQCRVLMVHSHEMWGWGRGSYKTPWSGGDQIDSRFVDAYQLPIGRLELGEAPGVLGFPQNDGYGAIIIHAPIQFNEPRRKFSALAEELLGQPPIERATVVAFATAEGYGHGGEFAGTAEILCSRYESPLDAFRGSNNPVASHRIHVTLHPTVSLVESLN